jgi:hypothetical protein
MNPNGSRSKAKEMGFDSPYDVDKASLATYQTALETEPHVPFGVASEPYEVFAARAARSAIDYYVPGEPTVRGLFQKELRAAKIKWESENREKGFVTDRTTLDDLAYTLMHDRGAVTEANVAEAVAHTLKYDVVIFCPIEHGCWLDGDSARVQGDPIYHQTYDAMLRGMLGRYGVPKKTQFIMLKTPLLGVRKELIRKVLTDRFQTLNK